VGPCRRDANGRCPKYAVPRQRREVRDIDAGASALGQAARRTLPLVVERRGTVLRDTPSVGRKLTLAAVDLFAERGFEQVTISDIAERAGVNKRTFFRYFPTKETVVLDIFDQTNASLLLGIATAEGADPTTVVHRAVVSWCAEFEALLLGLAALEAESETLAGAIALRSFRWEDRLAAAIVERFPGVPEEVAQMTGVMALGGMRVGRRRADRVGEHFPVAVANILAASQSAGRADRET
jgi:AcrR family transcriptional regulator